MLTRDPKERALLWARATTASDPDRRYAFLKELAEHALDEAVASHFDLYDYELRGQFVEAMWVLDEANALDADMLRIFQGMPHDPSGASARFLDAIVGRLGEVADEGEVDPGLRERASHYCVFWRERAPGRLLTVQEVAQRYEVSDKAVYKWIKEGKVRAERTPGGSIRGIPAAELSGARSTRNLASLATSEALAADAAGPELLEHSGVTPAFEAVLADRVAGRTHSIPPRRYNPVHVDVIEQAEAAGWQNAEQFPTEYPDGFSRRPAFGPRRRSS